MTTSPRSPGAMRAKIHLTLVHDVGQGYLRLAWLDEGTAVPRGVEVEMKASGHTHGHAAVTPPIQSGIVVPSAGAAESTGTDVGQRVQAAAAGDGQAPFVAVAASDADYAGLKADVEAAGGRVVQEMPQVGTLVVKAPKAARAAWRPTVAHGRCGVGPHRVHRRRPRRPQPGRRTASSRSTWRSNTPSVTPDPASSIPGLLWNEQRVNMTDAWKVTAG